MSNEIDKQIQWRMLSDLDLFTFHIQSSKTTIKIQFYFWIRM